ncbi:MAG TPA: GNAT family N-acetyltransferase [Symbiobacteriaceae bacterium]|nr:GNAT family N-acetyltransferase [Symbiobacteriaceae bacterium]
MTFAVDSRPTPEIISILRAQRSRLVAPRGDGYFRSRLEGNSPVSISLDGAVIGYAALETRLTGKIGVLEFYVRTGCGRYLTAAWEVLRAEVRPDYLLVRTDDPIAMQLGFDLQLPVLPGALYMEREASVRLEERSNLQITPLTAETFDEAFAVLQPESPWEGGHSEEEREPMRETIGSFRYNTLQLDGKVIGVGMLTEEEEGVLDIGMVIHRDYRRQGMAAYLLSNLASDMEEKGYRVMAGLSSENLASRKSLEKAGFRVVYAWWTPELR